MMKPGDRITVNGMVLRVVSVELPMARTWVMPGGTDREFDRPYARKPFEVQQVVVKFDVLGREGSAEVEAIRCS